MEDDESFRNEKLVIYAKKTDALNQYFNAMNTIIGVRQVPPSRPRSNQSKNMRQKPMHMITCVCYNKYSNHNEQQKKEEPHDV